MKLKRWYHGAIKVNGVVKEYTASEGETVPAEFEEFFRRELPSFVEMDDAPKKSPFDKSAKMSEAKKK